MFVRFNLDYNVEFTVFPLGLPKICNPSFISNLSFAPQLIFKRMNIPFHVVLSSSIPSVVLYIFIRSLAFYWFIWLSLVCWFSCSFPEMGSHRSLLSQPLTSVYYFRKMICKLCIEQIVIKKGKLLNSFDSAIVPVNCLIRKITQIVPLEKTSGVNNPNPVHSLVTAW